jgi:hypothetical protein
MGVDTSLLFKRSRSRPVGGKVRRGIRKGRDFVIVFWPVRFSDVAGSRAKSGLLVSHEFEALVAVHRDRRGVLAFPDVIDPNAASYRGIVAEVGDGGTWLPLRRTKRRRARLAVPATKHPPVPDDAENVVTRELPAISGAVAMSGERFAPTKVVQTTFRTRQSAAAVAKFYLHWLSAQGLKVSRESTTIEFHEILQLVARASERAVTVQVERARGAATIVRVTSMTH